MEAFHQYDKLIATNARYSVAGANLSLQALAELLEQRVAGGVTERVVDGLEVVNVQIQDRELLALACGALTRELQAVVQEVPVWQSGQLVVLRHVRELILERLTLGEILDQHVEAFAIRGVVCTPVCTPVRNLVRISVAPKRKIGDQHV